jgi:host factor-I protein
MDQSPHALQNEFLQALRANKTPVSVYLVNGIRLHGHIEFFDNYMIAVRNAVTQLVYKHAISSIFPAMAEQAPLERSKQSNAKPNGVERTKSYRRPL